MMAFVKNLLFALGLAVLLGIGYIVFIQKEQDPVVSVDGGGSSASLQTQEFLLKLNSLSELNLDGSLFEDQRFKSLVNYRRPLIDNMLPGRKNPFAPVGQE